jgi:UrcA family protein
VFRTLTATTLFALSLTTAAQADPATLNDRIHAAAENVCAPLLEPRGTSLLYKKWHTDCVDNAAAEITARVQASRATSTALLSK